MRKSKRLRYDSRRTFKERILSDFISFLGKDVYFMTPVLQPQLEKVTLEQYEMLPEEKRFEVFDGVIYDMASRFAGSSGTIHAAFYTHQYLHSSQKIIYFLTLPETAHRSHLPRFKRRGIFSAAIGAAFDFCVKFFTCHGKIHFIDGNAIGMADFAECVDWIRIFPCLKQFFTQNGVCLCFFLPSFCLHCREVLSSP